MQTLNSNTEWHFVHFLSICEILNCSSLLCVFSNTNNPNTGWHLLQTLRLSIPSALVRQRQSGCLFTSIDMTIESAKEKEASRQSFPVDLVCSNQSSAKFEESWDRTWKQADQFFLLHTFHYTWAQKCLLRKVKKEEEKQVPFLPGKIRKQILSRSVLMRSVHVWTLFGKILSWDKIFLLHIFSIPTEANRPQGGWNRLDCTIFSGLHNF